MAAEQQEEATAEVAAAGPTSQQIDWEALWVEEAGPELEEEDLALAADLFTCLDKNDDGVLQRRELTVFRNALDAACVSDLFEVEDCDGEDDEDSQVVDPAAWVAFHVAALTSFGRGQWRQALEGVAAVCRVTRSSVPCEEPFVLTVGDNGKIVSTWFSRSEMTPEEKAACRALKDAEGWRCLSCEAEALENQTEKKQPLMRSLSYDTTQKPTAVGRATSWHNLELQCSSRSASKAETMTPVAEEDVASRDGSKSVSPAPTMSTTAGGTSRATSSSSSPWTRKTFSGGFNRPKPAPSPEPEPRKQCSTLTAMLSHRALRPLRKRVLVGDRVVVENVTKGVAKQSDLGMAGTVKEVYIPEKAVVKEEWCRVVITAEQDGHSSHEVVVPVRNVASLKVPLHPGDSVEAHRQVRGRMGEKTKGISRGTVLGVGGDQAHKVEISFGPRDTERVPLSWVTRAEMSAWTQVMRQAPHSTLLFLLCDLNLRPSTSADEAELEDRLRRDFEPHGRFRYVGDLMEPPDSPGASPRGLSSPRGLGSPRCVSNSLDRLRSGKSFQLTEQQDASDSAPPGSLRARRNSSDQNMLSPLGDSRRLAIGDTGKVLSFDLDAMMAEVMPDRKKHLRLKVAFEALEPDGNDLPVAAKSGPTKMHTFAEDPPILAAVKASDTTELRKRLAEAPFSEMVRTLLEDSLDADGNTPFHAVVYERSKEMWKILWSTLQNALISAPGGGQDVCRKALALTNDWGRSPLWIALESREAEFCQLLLLAGASAEQEAPVITEGEETDDLCPHEFCGGPGLVPPGIEYKVTFYSTTPSCGLKFGHPGGPTRQDDAVFEVVRSFGEAAGACVMAGDLLLSIEDKPASECGTFRRLERSLATADRPLTLHFRKGEGLQLRPLHRACELGCDDIVQLLLDYSADPVWRDACGRSALDRAVRQKNRSSTADAKQAFERCIAKLIEAGASEENCVTVLDADGSSQPFEPPDHWSVCPEMRLQGRFWLSIEDVSSETVLVEHFQRVIDRSLGTIGGRRIATKDRRDGPAPISLTVERVQRVQNVACLREYLHRRHLMRQQAKNTRGHPILQVEDLKVKVDYGILAANSDAISPLDTSLNEVFLFHGTSPKGASGIAHEDFMLALAGSAAGSAFGKGIYFAEDCMKADEYTAEAKDAHPFAGLRPMLLCRVLLGRMLVSEESDVSYEITSVMQGHHDSLCADRKAAVGTFREFIVFDEDQACAEYILWYRRRT